MPLAVDHLVYATPDLERSVAELARRWGVEASPGGRHVGRGTHNALLHLGGPTYLEIIGPDPSQDLPRGTPLPFGLESRQEAGLVWFAVACRGLAPIVSRLRAAGFEAGDPFDMQRARPDGVTLRWQLSSLAQIPPGGTEAFLIDWLDSPHPSQDTPRGCVLRRLVLRHPDPARTQRYLALISPEQSQPGPHPGKGSTDTAEPATGPGGRVEVEVEVEVVVEASPVAGLVAHLDTPQGPMTLG